MSLWLLMHLAGVVLFLGNIITAAFWKSRADGTNNPAEIHSASKNVMLADYLFTLPGLVLIVVSGSIMAASAGMPLMGLNWLTLSLILFAVTGVLWVLLLIPLQRKMIRHSLQSIESGVISKEYRDASRSWNLFGIAALLLPVVILYLMVTQGF